MFVRDKLLRMAKKVWLLFLCWANKTLIEDLAIVVASVWLVEHEMQEAEAVHRCLRLGLS